MPTFSASMLEPPLQHKKHVAPFTTHGNVLEPALQSKKSEKSALRSDSAVIMEPSLQRKKKPVTTDVQSKQISENSDDYILLGDQSKFASNIKYKTKNLKRPALNSTEGNNNNNNKTMVDECLQAGKRRPEKFSTIRDRPQRPQRPSRRRPKIEAQPSPVKVKKPSTQQVVQPPPKAVVDTGAPCLKAVATGNGKSNSCQASEASHLKSSDVTATKKSADSVEKSEVPKKKLNKKTSEVVGKDNQKIVEQKNELNRINSGKAKVDASQEPQENYALKYQAGLTGHHPSRSKTRLSEYQKEFTWKKGIHSSPLIAAEQVVYKSMPEMTAPKASKMPRSTEYQKEFKPWTLARSMPSNNQGAEPSRQVRRSKSVEAVSRTPAAGLERVTSESDKRLIMQTTSPRKPRLPQTKPRIFKSEYALNFREPAQYVYENGAWKGDNHPQIQAADHPEVSASASSVASSWFMEVQELRRRADEYKKRAQGTHFGREHLAQLYAQQTELWDSASVSSLLSDLTLKGSDVSSVKKTVKSEVNGEVKKDEDVIPKKREAWTKLKDDESLPSSVTSWKGLVPAEKHRSVGVETSGDGSTSSPQRHHLDRTTPATGGLLLVKHKPTEQGDGHMDRPLDTTVDKKAYKQIQATNEEHVSENAADEMLANGTTDDDNEIANDVTQQVVPLSAPSPAFGMPTKDTHLLMDEELSHDEPLKTEFVQSPLLRKPIKSAWQDINRRKGIDTKNSTGPFTDWKKLNIDFKDRDDDQISVSARSVASSCSLASQVLERARNRRDEFWGNMPIGQSHG